jgi:FtsZ-binding cell division protein ZapB
MKYWLDRNKYVLVLFVSLVLVVGGSFYAGNYLAGAGTVPDPGAKSTEQILEEARNNVPEPERPPMPQGREIIETRTETVSIPRTVITMRRIEGPFGAFVEVPEVQTRNEEVTREVQVPRLVDAPPEEIERWNAQVRQLEADYQRRLRAEIARLSTKERERVENAADVLTEFTHFVSTIITPLIVTLTGLAGAVIAFLQVFGVGATVVVAQAAEPASKKKKAA